MKCSWQLLFSITGTVVYIIWWQVLFMTVYTGALVYLYHYFHIHTVTPEEKEAAMPNEGLRILNLNITEVLSVVTGMLLVFRTNTAYSRFWDGRGIWSEMVSQIRILTRTIWVMVDDKKDSKLLVEKVTALNMLVAFAYGAKHYLREEYSRREEDMGNLISFLPRLLIPMSTETVESQERPSTTTAVAKNNDALNKNVQLGKETGNPIGAAKARRSSPYLRQSMDIAYVTGNIPLEISCCISAYIINCKERGMVDSPTCRILDTAVGNLVRCLTGFEKIRRTPIPLAYSAHLNQITWIVVLMLPFQWIGPLKWYAIPATAIASFALLGILAIGREIENPFGYDYNDLNLDDFCQLIHKEVTAIVSQPVPKAEVWMFSVNNHPLIAHPTLSAPALAEMNYEEVCAIMASGKDYKFYNPSKASMKSTPSKSSHKVGDKSNAENV